MLFETDKRRAEFESLAAAEEKRLYGLCYHILKNREDAEDCAQEALMKAYAHYNVFRSGGNFSAWISRIAVNCCRDLIRRRKSTSSLDELQEKGFLPPDPRPGAYEQLEKQERLRLLQEALGRMSEDDRILITLRDIQGRDYREISRILRLKDGTVKSRLNRARHKLAQILSAHGELFVPGSVYSQEGGEET